MGCLLWRLLTSNQGAQFTSTMWASMSSSLVMMLAATAAYHPESTGMVERLHRRLKEAPKAHLMDAALGPLGIEGHHQGRSEGLPC